MNSFFSRFKPAAPDTSVSAWSTLATFYTLMIFLIAIPFILIVSLVWLNSLLGFSTYIFAALTCLCVLAFLRIYRSWQSLKARMTAQGSEFGDLMRDAARDGKDIEISLLSGLFTLRYHGAGLALPQSQAQPLALEGPLTMEAQVEGSPSLMPTNHLREELEEFSRLRDSGLITAEEYDRVKTILLRRISA